jgi:hypothetical protein
VRPVHIDFEEIVVVGKHVVCRVAAAFAVAAMTVSAAVAQEHHRHGRHGGTAHGASTLSLLGNEAVQKELALNADQTEKVKDLVAEVHAEWKQQMQAARGPAGGDENSQGERPHRSGEMRGKFAEISKSVNEKFRARVAQILDGAQQTRLREIGLQIAGPRAFQDAEVARELGLTSQQQEQLAAVHHEYAEKFTELRQGGRQEGEGGRQNGEAFSKMRGLRQEELTKSIGVLTPEQQTKFATMTGKPFDLSQLHQAQHGHHSRGNRAPSA